MCEWFPECEGFGHDSLWWGTMEKRVSWIGKTYLVGSGGSEQGFPEWWDHRALRSFNVWGRNMCAKLSKINCSCAFARIFVFCGCCVNVIFEFAVWCSHWIYQLDRWQNYDHLEKRIEEFDQFQVDAQFELYQIRKKYSMACLSTWWRFRKRSMTWFTSGAIVMDARVRGGIVFSNALDQGSDCYVCNCLRLKLIG